jgi:hypothetical protein
MQRLAPPQCPGSSRPIKGIVSRRRPRRYHSLRERQWCTKRRASHHDNRSGSPHSEQALDSHAAGHARSWFICRCMEPSPSWFLQPRRMTVFVARGALRFCSPWMSVKSAVAADEQSIPVAAAHMGAPDKPSCCHRMFRMSNVILKFITHTQSAPREIFERAILTPTGGWGRLDYRRTAVSQNAQICWQLPPHCISRSTECWLRL